MHIGGIAFANSATVDMLDSYRSQLACQKDKSSQNYIKLKNKFDKFLVESRIDYSPQARYEDTIRLINEKKYDIAIFEINNLIAENHYTTKCYEFLGDISVKSETNYSKAVKYYKQALKENSDNVSAAYKLAKIYLKLRKNIMGLEYLKYTVNKTQNPDVLNEIEYMLKNAIEPSDRFDANNMYEILGDLYVRRNDKEGAFTAYNNALKLNPNDLYLKYYLGDLYYSIGEDKNAAFVYNAILSENPSDSGIRTSRAKALSRDGDLLSADSEYRKILELNPNSTQALYGLYKIYERKLTPDKILEKIYSDVPNYKPTKAEILKFAKVLEPTNDLVAINAYISYAQNLEKIEKEKIEAQRRVDEEKRKAIEAEKQRVLQIQKQKQEKIRQEQEKIRLQKEAEAKKKAELEAARLKKLEEQKKALELARQEKLKKEQLAKEQAKRLQEEKLRKEQLAKEEAKRLQEEKIRKEKERKLALQKQQEEKKLEQQRIQAEKKAYEERLAFERKQKEEELKLQKQAELERKKEEQRLKEEQLKIEKQKEAERLAEEKARQEKLLAEKKQKEYEDKLIVSERQKAMQKDLAAYNKAMAQIENYQKESPMTAQSYVAVANTYKMTNQNMSAIRNYKEAMKLDPTNSDIYYNLGLSYMELNSFVTSRANLTKAVNLDKSNTKAVNLLAFVNQKLVTSVINNAFAEFEKKEYMAAYDILNDGIKEFPKNSQLYYYRAVVADAMGRNAAQILDLQKSIELDPSHYMSFYQLAKAYEKINDERNALVAYERFLSIEPEEKELVDEVQKKVLKLSEKYY